MPVEANFRVVDCCGKDIGCVDLTVDLDRFADYPDFDEFDIALEYAGEVLSALGLVQHTCDGCYDSAYRVICDDYEDRPYTSEEAFDAGYIELLISDAAGVYIPKEWCEACADYPGWSGFDKDDVETCLAGPDEEWYWEAWDNISQNAEFTNPKDGSKWMLWQDGDLWAVRSDIDIDWD